MKEISLKRPIPLFICITIISVIGLNIGINFAEAKPSSSQDKAQNSRGLTPKGAALLKDLASLKFDRLGHPAVRWDSIPPVKASAQRPHQLLVVLVRFADLGFDRFQGEPNAAQRLTQYYQHLLFDPTYTRPNTLSHYFADQSYRQYHLQGTVLPPITLDHARAHYGRPKRPEGGSWRNDSDSEGLVEEVLNKVGKAHPTLDWQSFDQWDPNDVDQDLTHEEADGYLDHLVIVYAGGGQSSCQGLYKLSRKLNPNVDAKVFKSLSKNELECADRIWPHRFKVQRREGEGPIIEGTRVALGGAPITEKLWARDYNMQSEYTEISTFIHEFGHSIGLPDIYARQTNNSTGPWELMSSTKSPSPQSLSAWSRIMLGWLHPTVIMPPEAGGATQLSTSLVTIDTPPSQYEKLLAPAVAKSKQMLHEANKTLIKPVRNNEKVSSLIERSQQMAEELKTTIQNSELAQEAKSKIKTGFNQVKKAVKEEIDADPRLKRAVKRSGQALSAGAETLKSGVAEAKKSLKQLAPTRALLIPLPPQPQTIELIKLKPEHGQWALYSGQGNELNRSITINLDLSALPVGSKVSLSMDAWWAIEAGWDFVYVEARENRTNTPWTRLVDPRRMLAKHGHDGPKSLPGFTGRSGDLDGDGKNENAPGCDPKAEIAHGEDKKGIHPCEHSTWSDAQFDLSSFVGRSILVRLRYFTDPAAVERGILIDRLSVKADGQTQPLFYEDFEGDLSTAITLDGFLKSSSIHHFEVPHFYVVEHRDPYAGASDPKAKNFRYDSALGKAAPIFGYQIDKEEMSAVRFRARPGALIWYVNGRYAWSENEPTQNGSGKGFLLAVDANPNEYQLPGLSRFYKGTVDANNTHYDFSDPQAQELLKRATLQTICFVRTSWSYPRDLPKDLFYTCPGSQLPKLRINDKIPMFVYEVINRLLPGKKREPFIKASELFDFKIRKNKISWHLRNRAIRSLHMYDAPFSSTPFANGIEYLKVSENTLKTVKSIDHPARPQFSDHQSWQNPHLRFGGVAVPHYGLDLTFTDEKGGVNIDLQWK